MKKIDYYDVQEFNNLKEMLEETTKKFGDRPAYFVKSSGSEGFSPITYNEFKRDVDSLGTALIDMGLKNQKIAVIGENSYEWATTYIATVTGVGCIVPLDRELPESELESLLIRSEASAIFFTDKKKDAIINISKRISTIKYYISMTKGDPTNLILDFHDVISTGKKLLENNDTRYLDAEINNTEMNMLLFTSGTTSTSKGVMLSHKNICSNIAGFQSLVKFHETDVFLSILPIHHSYEATIGFLSPLSVGAAVGHCEGLRYIGKNLNELKPTIMPCVPAIVESIYKKIRADLEKSIGEEQSAKLLNGELEVDKAKMITDNVRESLGGKIRLFICAAAATPSEIVRGMRMFGALAMQGYGLTETAPGVCMNRIDNYKDAAVGFLFPNMEMKIENANDEGVGELVLRGPNIMLGYYKDPEETEKVLKDGWFYTGDLGYIDEDGFIYITGRKKNVIITKNGKNVYPEELEALLKLNKYIKECMVYEQNLKNRDASVVAVSILPNLEAIQEDFGDVDEDSILSILKKEINQFNKTLVSYKVIRYVELRQKEFAKTTSMKIKRYVQG